MFKRLCYYVTAANGNDRIFPRLYFSVVNKRDTFHAIDINVTEHLVVGKIRKIFKSRMFDPLSRYL